MLILVQLVPPQTPSVWSLGMPPDPWRPPDLLPIWFLQSNIKKRLGALGYLAPLAGLTGVA